MQNLDVLCFHLKQHESRQKTLGKHLKTNGSDDGEEEIGSGSRRVTALGFSCSPGWWRLPASEAAKMQGAETNTARLPLKTPCASTLSSSSYGKTPECARF